MSNSELYYEELTDLSVRIALGIKNRTEPLDELSQAMTQLSQTNAIKGNAANAMKAYINEVHMTLIQTLELLLNNYEMALGKYVKGYLEVDSDESFKLIKEDFDAHKNNLSSHQSDFTSIGNKLKAISDEAEDIISLRGAGSKRLFNVAKDMGTMKEIVSNLNNKWNDYEQSDPGFNQVQDLIAQTTSLLKSTLSVPRGYSYSPGSFSKLISKDFVNAF
ncbi:T7SS effector LXG polymorphic toxin, partial [Clostridium acetobutylicum]